MKITDEKPNIVRVAYYQEKGDPDYGSCLWAYYNFDLDHWILSIQSDCGNYAYRWGKEGNCSFFQFCSQLSSDYLIKKLCKPETVLLNEIPEIAEEILQEMELEKEVYAEAMEDLRLKLDEFASEDSAAQVRYLLNDWNDQMNLDLDSETIESMVPTDYSVWQKRIVSIFCDQIQPALKTMY